MRIAVDAMGGDFAPRAAIQGAHAAAVRDGVSILLVGERARLEGCLLARGRVPAGAHYRESLLWADTPDADVAAVPL